jgi:hypothetical protein
MSRAFGITSALLTYFQERPGQVVTIDQLVKHFKLERKKIQGNMYNLRQNVGGESIEALRSGMWRYVDSKTTKTTAEVMRESSGESAAPKQLRPPPGANKQDSTKHFEILKTSEDGKHMVGMDDTGNVYKITHLA